MAAGKNGFDAVRVLSGVCQFHVYGEGLIKLRNPVAVTDGLLQ